MSVTVAVETAKDLVPPSTLAAPPRPTLQRQTSCSKLQNLAKRKDISCVNRSWVDALEESLISALTSSDDDDSDSQNSSDSEMTDVDEKPTVPTKTVPIVIPDMEPPLYPSCGYTEEIEEAEKQEQAMEDTQESEPQIGMTHHGMSRSALGYLRGFWSARQEEWERLEAQRMMNSAISSVESEAYGGIADVPRSPTEILQTFFSQCSGSSSSASSPSNDSDSPSTPDPNAPIFPRTGDLSRLHDARSAKMDYAFSNFPLHTINKTLYLHDMLDRVQVNNSHHQNLIEVSSLEDHLSSPVSEASYSDDDTTLVAEESSSYYKGLRKTDECAVKIREWEISWPARWRVLLSKTKENSLRVASGDTLHTFTLTSDPEEMMMDWDSDVPEIRTPSRPQSPKFFFALDDDDFSDLDDEEDDDDYGSLVRRPRYGGGLSAEILSKQFMSDF